MSEPTPREPWPTMTEAEVQERATGRLLAAIDSMALDQLEKAAHDPTVAPYLFMIAARCQCPFCAADWPIDLPRSNAQMLWHRRPESLKLMPSADLVECQAWRIRALAGGITVNPMVAAEVGTE